MARVRECQDAGVPHPWHVLVFVPGVGWPRTYIGYSPSVKGTGFSPYVCNRKSDVGFSP